MSDFLKLAVWLVAWPLRAVGMALGWLVFALVDSLMDGMAQARKWMGKP